MSTDVVEYTHAWENGEEFNSSAVDGIYYNANDKSVTVLWGVYLYTYATDMSLDDVKSYLIEASSVGRAAADLKHAYGRARYRGYSSYVTLMNVDDVTTPAPVATPQFSLATPPAPPAPSGDVREVYFELFGVEKVHSTSEAATDLDAVALTLASLEALDLASDAKVTKVVTYFG